MEDVHLPNQFLNESNLPKQLEQRDYIFKFEFISKTKYTLRSNNHINLYYLYHNVYKLGVTLNSTGEDLFNKLSFMKGIDNKIVDGDIFLLLDTRRNLKDLLYIE